MPEPPQEATNYVAYEAAVLLREWISEQSKLYMTHHILYGYDVSDDLLFSTNMLTKKLSIWVANGQRCQLPLLYT